MLRADALAPAFFEFEPVSDALGFLLDAFSFVVALVAKAVLLSSGEYCPFELFTCTVESVASVEIWSAEDVLLLLFEAFSLVVDLSALVNWFSVGDVDEA